MGVVQLVQMEWSKHPENSDKTVANAEIYIFWLIIKYNHQKSLFICLFDLKTGGKRYETTCVWLVDSHGCTV